MSYVMTKKADFDITSMQVVCFDAYPDENWIKCVPNASYTDMDTLLRTSDFISIHVPLLPSTHHLIDEEAFSKMKTDVILVNTSREEIVQLYCTVLYCTALQCTVLYSTVLYCTVLHCTVLYCTVLYCTVLYCVVLSCIVLYYLVNY